MGTDKDLSYHVHFMIEIPKGSRNKYEYDEERKVIQFDRMLFSSVHYPSDFTIDKDLKGKKVTTGGWADREKALAIIRAAQDRFNAEKRSTP